MGYESLMKDIFIKIGIAFCAAVLVLTGVFIGGKSAAQTFGNAISGNSNVFFYVASSSLESVGTSNTVVLASSTGRTWAKFSNNSTIPVFCRYANGAPAALNTGFMILASSTYEMNQLSSPVYTGAINCIAQGSAAPFYVEVNQ